ncbi:hypothetical protein [Kitasatospora sp. McL0602]|uniref:hypothetical protein n=1 Tax=Kitasatospora sp. McL0602 TaxID=3439530 RepID=UPI003F8BE2CA
MLVTVHTAQLRGVPHRVVRPAVPPAAVLLDHDRYLDLQLDADAARQLALLWELAARSPRSLVHLPLRAPTGGLTGGPGLDLVLLHHSLQFAPARWRELRRRLGPGRPQRLTLPEPDGTPADLPGRHHRGHRDVFHQHLAAETLFLTGSAPVFRATTHHFVDVARNGPGHPGPSHYCAQLYADSGVLAPGARELHLRYEAVDCPN